jgi:hypothetical protein
VAPTGGRHVLVIEGAPPAVHACWETVRGVDGLHSAPIYNSALTADTPIYSELGHGIHTFALERSVEQLLQDPHVCVCPTATLGADLFHSLMYSPHALWTAMFHSLLYHQLCVDHPIPLRTTITVM